MADLLVYFPPQTDNYTTAGPVKPIATQSFSAKRKEKKKTEQNPLFPITFY